MRAQDVIIALAEGNPGALNVCIRVAKEAAAIDQDNALASLGPLLTLDSNGIYGSRIWMLWKDVCGQDMINFLGVLRAKQLGIVSSEELTGAVQDWPTSKIDLKTVLELVREQLPRFGA